MHKGLETNTHALIFPKIILKNGMNKRFVHFASFNSFFEWLLTTILHYSVHPYAMVHPFIHLKYLYRRCCWPFPSPNKKKIRPGLRDEECPNPIRYPKNTQLAPFLIPF